MKRVSHPVVSDSLRPHGLYSLAVSYVHRILQAPILECIAISFPKYKVKVTDKVIKDVKFHKNSMNIYITKKL